MTTAAPEPTPVATPAAAAAGHDPAQRPTGARAEGIATLLGDGTVLDTWFPAPELVAAEAAATARLEPDAVSPELAALLGRDEARGVEVVAVRTTIADLAAPPVDAHDAYLRLHLLSHRVVRPNEIDLTGPGRSGPGSLSANFDQ